MLEPLGEIAGDKGSYDDTKNTTITDVFTVGRRCRNMHVVFGDEQRVGKKTYKIEKYTLRTKKR